MRAILISFFLLNLDRFFLPKKDVFLPKKLLSTNLIDKIPYTDKQKGKVRQDCPTPNIEQFAEPTSTAQIKNKREINAIVKISLI
ncbi:hypothetical protein AsAng_0009600 [Aureispira anguillae]|uniref:Uncharacterized protein n=1 Tax=Aureispira anguillae TaxID=2864201 RepID=A0A915YBW9_9BACT|nr:hypothetical protein AsAng_0009600 [Aureispira anguillae]